MKTTKGAMNLMSSFNVKKKSLLFEILTMKQIDLSDKKNREGSFVLSTLMWKVS